MFDSPVYTVAERRYNPSVETVDPNRPWSAAWCYCAWPWCSRCWRCAAWRSSCWSCSAAPRRRWSSCRIALTRTCCPPLCRTSSVRPPRAEMCPPPGGLVRPPRAEINALLTIRPAYHPPCLPSIRL
eukprot:3919659-Pyramimonas_sp.AAC.1